VKLVVNDSHPSGTSFPADTSTGFSYAASGAGQYEQAAHGVYAQQGQPAAYDGYSTGSFAGQDFSYDQDPLFGSMPGTDGAGWTSGTYDAYSGQSTYDTGTYETGTYGTGAYDTGTYDTGGYDTGAYDTGSYDTNGAWTQAGFLQPGDIPAQPGPDQADFGWNSGQWDTTQWSDNQWETGGQWDAPGPNGGWDAYGYDQTAAHTAHAQGDETNAGYAEAAYEGYESYDGHDAYEPAAGGAHGIAEQHQQAYADETFAHGGDLDATTALPAYDGYESYDGLGGADGHHGIDDFDVPGGYDAYDTPDAYGAENPVPRGADAPDVHPERDLRVAHLPGRRRSARPRRSALLTVAVPSVAVMGVAAAAAASVAGNAPQDDTTTQASADVPVKPANKKLDTQLAGLSADADDFADRASRTQERLDLQARQEAERKRKAREAARKEALRPKFALPVKEHGLSATYGQAGLNWMSVHTGIDFPVSEGTPVMAATDGTVTTKYDVSFGNMAVVTAPDGTETWYCHLSSTKIRSGQVKAGDTIGYSGTSGNSTGPHLHFEVHPGGGEAIDPLPWLRGKGLNPQ
jgi:murein DD-endopeptidase MepM/ murein hydrolase activator NlpD